MESYYSNIDIEELSKHIQSLPQEIQNNILIQLDPKTLAHMNVSDNIIWKQVALRENYQDLKLDYEGKNIFLETPFAYLNEKYLRLNPLYIKAQELESYLQPKTKGANNDSRYKQTQHLMGKVTQGTLNNQIAYMKAIIGSDICHKFVLSKGHPTFPGMSWSKQLRRIIPQHPDIILWLLTSKPFQASIVPLFIQIVLKDVFSHLASKRPTIIEHLLENKTIQETIRVHKDQHHILDTLLGFFEKSLGNPTLERLKQKFFFDETKHTEIACGLKNNESVLSYQLPSRLIF